MSLTTDVDGFRLTMPSGWRAWKYDDSDFQQHGFQSFAGGSKAMDVLALDPDGALWLIELKDYRRHRRRKASSVYAEVAGKLRATLAGVATARVHAPDMHERAFAAQAMNCTRLRVVLQLAQSSRPHRLSPRAVDPADANTQLRRAVKPVDPDPICATGSLGDINGRLPWHSEDI